MSTVINGTDLMVFVEGVSIAYATNHTLSISVETTDTSAKSKDNAAAAWATVKPKTMSWSMTSENLYSEDATAGKTYTQLRALMNAGTKVNLVFCVKDEDTATSVPTAGWTPGASTMAGEAYITSLDLNAPDDDNSTFSVSFTGTGALS